MQKFKLELLFRIIGIGSASGLFFNNNSLFLISDNSNILYEYKMDEKKLNKIPLAAKIPLENIAKKDKPDYEAIAKSGGFLYLFGSGSTPNRNMILPVNLKTGVVGNAIDATDLYYRMQDFGQIDADNFNVEAAVNDGNTWYLFNRGNGPKGKNSVFTVMGNLRDGGTQMLHNDIDLPAISGAPASFTDAVKVGNKIYFLAAAEKTNSTYHDGEVAGTLIGRLDPESMEVEFTEIISTRNKFEGITIYKETAKTVEFLLCEDTDSEVNESDIYKLTVNK